MSMLYIIFIFLISTNTYSDISKIRVFPSGIFVNFEVPEQIKEEEPIKKKWVPSWRRKKEEVSTNIEPPKLIKFSKFIRVINSLENIDENHTVALAFYDKDETFLLKKIITNSTKLSAKYVFFMDRNTGKKFQGMRDIYYIPEETQYLMIGIFDEDDNLIISATHPEFDKDNKIQLSDYYKISPNRPIMIQFELLGTPDNTTTRVGSFYFVR